jgi:hypothetical protein
MAKNQAKMQVVEDDEVENVGIMSGFMEDIEALMEEIAQQEMGGGDDEDMAKILDRSPGSTEVLMNNLRGDYRSIDARREELADMVGYNAAAQTPDEVLAMLQPVLAQQGIAALPMGGADVGALPMDAMTGMPGGQPPMDPAMMGGMPPMDPAMMDPAMMDPAMMGGMPPQGIESLPMDQGAMPPMQMARGGVVQHFRDGSDAEGVTSENDRGRRLPPSLTAQQYIEDLLAPSVSRPRPEIMARTRELTPNYEELLGVSDKGSTRAQMLFDIAQTALGYAANVGPDGQPLRGSAAARLAGATRALPGQIGARATQAKEDETRARLAAMQQAQSEISAAEASDLSREEARQKLLLEYAKQGSDKSARLLTAEELASPQYSRLDPALPWMIDESGKPSIAGGRPGAPLVNVGAGETVIDKMLAEKAVSTLDNAETSVRNIPKLDDTLALLQTEDINLGFGAEFRTNVDRVAKFLLNSEKTGNRVSNTELLDAMLGSDVFPYIQSLGIGARGLDTPAEREFLRKVMTGSISLDKDTLIKMTLIRKNLLVREVETFNRLLEEGQLKILESAYERGGATLSPIALPGSKYEPDSWENPLPAELKPPSAEEYDAEIARRRRSTQP